ncbi:GMC oxidoreductase-like protein [Paraphoma chrysanthemicola]|nr:GMC oxidoreductase-like protein [Paraphoma chrysanthemicola]
MPHASVSRQISELDEHYDFIIAGGGTAGLTVADRLSAALPEKSILVVEYGDIEYARGLFDPPDLIYPVPPDLPRPGWSFTSLPNPAMKDRTASLLAGRTVGGSSAINGQYFDRPARADFEAWEALCNPNEDLTEEKWDWDSVYPYFKKSVTFTPPEDSVKQQYGYTWDLEAYGGTTPIHSSFPPFLWGDQIVARHTWEDMGIGENKECADGNKAGICWIPASQHPITARRSHAGLGHYAEVLPRTNYHLLVKHQVIRVIYPSGPNIGPPLVEIRSLETNQFTNLTAKTEVILSAGALHTPTILHRSGIGASFVLSSFNISTLIDLPGVGANLQDHSSVWLSWNYTQPGNFSPTPNDMLDPVFAADAARDFDEFPARGPYTIANANTGLYLPLRNITSKYEEIVNAVITLANNTSEIRAILPVDYDANPTLLAGYLHQLRTFASSLVDPSYPTLESLFATGQSLRSILLHPLSRGTVRLNASNIFEQPILDYRAGSNPVDFDLHIAHVQFLRGMWNTSTLRSYGAVEVLPGIKVQSDEEMLEYIRDSAAISLLHPCCTAAMMPRDLGGVVGTDLSVHGATGLRVVDISALPVLVGSHTSSLAYALGEKAADIILKKWRKEEASN